MKRFNDETWNQFLIDYCQTKRVNLVPKKMNKGLLFEVLIEDLLKLHFSEKNISFKATKQSHDGSKDFWSVDEFDKLWWAECKNYSSSVSMTVLSPTLLMAELYEVDYLMFFSYSKLNENVKRKIGLYGRKNNKRVYIFDDDVLEQLIQEYIPIDTYSDSNEQKINTKTESSIEIIRFNELSPMFLNSKHFSGSYKVVEFKIGEVYNINVLLINRSLRINSKLTVTLTDWKDRYYFNIIDPNNINSNEKICLEVELEPCQAYMLQFAVRLVKFKGKLSFPKLQVDITHDDTQKYRSKPEKELSCIMSSNDTYIGNQYTKIVTAISEKCINKEQIAGFLIYGTSGTGKTRILKECSVNFRKANYEILSFFEFDAQNDWTSLVKELVYYVFSINQDIAFDILCETLEKDTTGILIDKEKSNILNFLRLLNSDKFSYDELEKYFKLIFEKMRRKKYVIIIDNIQSYAPEIVRFVKAFLSFYLHVQEPTNLCIMLSLNRDLVFSETYSTLLSLFIQLKSNSMYTNFVCEEINGFTDANQAIIFLKSILKLNHLPLSQSHLVRILKKSSLKPKYIEQVAQFILNQNCIKTYEDKHYITDEKAFINAITTLPLEYSVVFKENYSKICNEYSIWDKAGEIVALLYFFGSLNEMLIKIFEVEDNVLLILDKHNIIVNGGTIVSRNYLFEHDLSALCLTIEIYPKTFKTAINKLNSKIVYMEQISRAYPVEYEIFKMANYKYSIDNLPELVTIKRLNSVSNRLQRNYHELFLANLIHNVNSLEELDFILLAKKSCIYVRDHISEVIASDLFDTVFSYIDSFTISSQLVIKEYFSFIVHMAENKVRVGKVENAMKLYTDYLRTLEEIIQHTAVEEEMEYTKAYIYNRIFVCGKHEGDTEKYLSYLIDSKKICETYSFHDTMFENYFDEANIYLNERNDLPNALMCLEKGFTHYSIMGNDNQNKYKVNYYSKRILYLCLCSKFKEAYNMANEALVLLEFNDKINYHLFFKARYLKYKILSLLLMQDGSSKLEAAIEDYCFVLNLLGGDHTVHLLYIKSKYALLRKDITAFSFFFEYMYLVLSETEVYNHKNTIILENLAISYREHISMWNIQIKPTSSNCEKANKVLIMQYDKYKSFLENYINLVPLCDLSGSNWYIL